MKVKVIYANSVDAHEFDWAPDLFVSIAAEQARERFGAPEGENYSLILNTDSVGEVLEGAKSLLSEGVVPGCTLELFAMGGSV